MKALNELITAAVQLAGAEVLGRSEPYVAGLIRSGVISKNALGKVPIADVHLAVAGEALGKQRGRAA